MASVPQDVEQGVQVRGQNDFDAPVAGLVCRIDGMVRDEEDQLKRLICSVLDQAKTFTRAITVRRKKEN